eukprot:1027726-Rhodomonas_salina.1
MDTARPALWRPTVAVPAVEGDGGLPLEAHPGLAQAPMIGRARSFSLVRSSVASAAFSFIADCSSVLTTLASASQAVLRLDAHPPLCFANLLHGQLPIVIITASASGHAGA